MKVLIINQHTSNRGDEALGRALLGNVIGHPDIRHIDILYNAIDVLKEEKIRLPAVSPGKTIEHHAHLRLNLFEKLLILLTLILPFTIMRRTFTGKALKREFQLLNSADKIINASGGVSIGPYRDWRYLWRLYVALKLKKPVAIYSISFGPLPGNFLFRRASLFVLHSVEFLSLRDRRSQDFAKEMNIKYVPSIDTAFMEQPRKLPLPFELESLGDKLFTIFIFNELYRWHPNYKRVNARALNALYTNILDSFIDLGVTVVMIPFLFGKQNDLHYLESLRASIRRGKDVIILDDKFDSDAIQSIICRAQFLVGSRSHAIVFSIRNHVPFYALSYEHKIREMLTILNLSHCGVDLKEMLSGNMTESVIDRIHETFNNRELLKTQVIAAEQLARQIALDTFEQFRKGFLS